MPELALNLLKPDWPAPINVSAFCTTRIGGNSLKPFDGFNLATHVGDDLKQVLSNRAELKQALGLTVEPAWLNQTHSTEIASLTAANNYNPNADAAITRDKNTIAVVMTADCLPLLICNRHGDEVAAIHAGWRGLADGIVQATVEKMESSAEQLMAWIGPAITQPKFEVGDEVRELFVQNNQQAAARFIGCRSNHWLCDLSGLAADLLSQCGVQSVYFSGLCTYSLQEQFYSYRRENQTGRTACLIWINSNA